MRYSDHHTRHRSRLCKEWAEEIGQSLNYAMHTRKRPGVALIVLSPSDNKYTERVRKISAEYSLGLTIYPIDGGGVSKSGEKEFWITSSGKTHNSSCRYWDNQKRALCG